MTITIHRGTNQIGGCVTEYEANGLRLFVDFGEQLPGAPVSAQPLKVFGHEHDAYGILKQDGTVFSNAALLDRHYVLQRAPRLFIID